MVISVSADYVIREEVAAIISDCLQEVRPALCPFFLPLPHSFLLTLLPPSPSLYQAERAWLKDQVTTSLFKSLLDDGVRDVAMAMAQSTLLEAVKRRDEQRCVHVYCSLSGGVRGQNWVAISDCYT